MGNTRIFRGECRNQRNQSRSHTKTRIIGLTMDRNVKLNGVDQGTGGHRVRRIGGFFSKHQLVISDEARTCNCLLVDMKANRFGRSERFGRDCSLLVVDVQNDFADKAGALYVKGGEQIVPLINEIRSAFQTVVFTKDWHPPGHISFASAHAGKRPFELLCIDSPKVARTLWPDHCVQNTWGAELHPELIVCNDRDIIFEKATKADKDSYSAFRDEAGEETALREILERRGISKVYVCGLAFDYCVGFTALDAAKAGFEAFLIENVTMSISKEGRQQMMQRLHDNGVHMVTYTRSE